MTTKTQPYKICGMQQKQFLEEHYSDNQEIHSDTGLPQETKKSQINNLTFHLRESEKEQTKSKVSKGRK